MSDLRPKRLLGKVVVVTGAARGQGAAEAEALTREGARVVATDVAPVGDCRRLDVSDGEQWAELAAELREAYGQVHGLVNNAGVTWRARVGDVRAEDFERVHSVNVTGPLLGIQHLSPLMPPGSSIVNVGSSAALTAHYCVSPGMIDTDGSRADLLADDHPMRGIARHVPLGRVGTPDDVVNAAVFLTSDEAAYITGANLVVDGGWSAVLPGATV
ncbi:MULTISPECIES: SDR family NAD(P)-dependent oxidoreductase [Streptomyces]|uniref:SDR family NAD(P)-dependent oxidoreductase n=1 Tax=Streptomyces rochei TaxID=1928 RepID=A0ABW7E2T0_STRRO|nr:SDR family oxidoreductase [Streptomyces sp. MBT28]